MLPVFGEDIGRNIFFVPLSERRKQLEADSLGRAGHGDAPACPTRFASRSSSASRWRLRARARRSAWSTRTAFCSPCPPRRWPSTTTRFPVVTGIDPGDPAASRKARMAVYQRLMAELDAERPAQLRADLRDRPDRSRRRARADARAGRRHSGALRRRSFPRALQRYKAHIAEWRQQYPKLAAVDLRYDQQVVLQMASGPA